MTQLHWAYIGNFDPPHSTENEYLKAIVANGHLATTWQENTPGIFRRLAEVVDRFDVVLWTRTVWPEMDFGGMWVMMRNARRAGVPVVGAHLDLWHGLPRSAEIDHHPFFRVDLLCTADGGHDADWDVAGVEHAWLQPGVSEAETVPAEPDPRYEADVAFVGSWQGYHPEDTHRAELVRWLKARGARFFPASHEPAVRGEDLRRLYATTKVNVGTSCFAGMGARNYWSDRIPETLGRGGFLLHPYVPGIEDHFTDGEHLRFWEAGDWVELGRLVDHYLRHEHERRRIAEQGRAHVLETATYTVRVRHLVDLLAERGLLRTEVAA